MDAQAPTKRGMNDEGLGPPDILCGSAAADSAWREILEYFAGATQIGLAAV